MKEGNYKPDAVWKLRGKQLAAKGITKDQVDAAYTSGGSGAMDEMMYGGRMGNNQPGDATKYKGRGFVQLTGKDNYKKYGEMLGLDLLNHPELAEDPTNAANIATAFYKNSGAQAAGKAGDFDAVSQKINGGQYGKSNGREDRLKRTQAYNTKYANGTPQPANATTAASAGSGSGAGLGAGLNNENKPVSAPAAAPAPASQPKSKRKPLTATGQKASAAGPATAEVVTNAPEAKPAVVAAPGLNMAEVQILKSGRTKAGSVPTAMGTVDYGAKAKAMLMREQEKPAGGTDGAMLTAMGTVGNKTQPVPQGQAKANAEDPAPPPADPSKAMGTVGAATDSGKQYGAGDIFSERKRIDEESKSKKAKLLSDFRSGKTTEDEYVKAAAEEDKARKEKKDSLAELSKKAEGGQFVSQAEMDKATGKVSAQPDKVNALSSAPPPLPEVQPAQAPPPPPVEVPGLEKLAKANEQQAAQQTAGSDKEGGKQGIPNIKTDFDDTMLVLMSYDRI